jgi:hypothetical protein
MGDLGNVWRFGLAAAVHMLIQMSNQWVGGWWELKPTLGISLGTNGSKAE